MEEEVLKMGINVSISETYDLKTRLNKMTLIGIHTPKKELIMKTYPGLCMNSKFVKIKSIDVVLSAVSQLAVSPDQVGEDATKIAPQDMLNPILYKAVSNESMSTLEARLQGLGGANDTVGQMVNYTPNHVTDLPDEFNVYYALLQDRDGFRIAHPQQGLSMKGLVPLVFEKYYNVGVNSSVENDNYPDIEGDTLNLAYKTAHSMRGKAHPMPRFNTTYLTSAANSGAGVNNNGMGNGTPYNAQTDMPEILPVYCGMILMPPSARTIMFYRMRVTCHLEFQEIRPITDIASFAQISTAYGSVVYHSDYSLQSKMLEKQENMVDTTADIDKIMEGR